MNKEELFLSFNKLDPVLIEESDQYKGKNMKKFKLSTWKKIVLASAATFALLIITPNVSPVAAHALEQLPVLGTIVKAFTFRNYNESSDQLSIEMEVPHVKLDKETNIVKETTESTETTQATEAIEAINIDIDNVANELIKEYQLALEEEDPHLHITMNYETIASTDKYFTLKLNCFQARGGGYEWNKFYTISYATGKQLALKDLFIENADYVSAISTDIISQMKDQMAQDENIIYFVDTDMPENDFKQIKADQNFYINSEEQLVIAFDEYEVAPGYMGTLEFIVNKAAIESILIQ